MQWFQNHQPEMWKILKILFNKREMSELALHTPDVQDPQNKLLMPEQTFDMPDVQDPQNEWPCLSRLLTLPLNVTVSPEVLRWKGCPMKIGFSALAPTKSVHIFIAVMYSFVSSK